MEWVRYSDKKPEGVGIYLWRMKSREVKGLTVVSRGKFRLRSLGNRHVLSPEFDCLSGGVLLLPEELEWAEDDKSMADITFEDLPPVKLCPFCRKAPEFKSFSSSYWGHRVGPEPYILNKFQLQCCEWVSKMTFESPFYAIEEWNKKLSS